MSAKEEWCDVSIGNGRLMIAPGGVYPAHERVRAEYERRMADLARCATEREHDHGWIDAGADVAFAAYDCEGPRTHAPIRTIYLLNIDWWTEQTRRSVTLRLADAAHAIDARRGRIEAITIAAGVAAWPDDPTMDVMDLEVHGQRVRITVQSDRGGRLRVFGADGGVRLAAVHAGGVQQVDV